MTAKELYEWLLQGCCQGFDDAEVLVCDGRDNPLTDGCCIKSALRLEEKDGESYIILQTG